MYRTTIITFSDTEDESKKIMYAMSDAAKPYTIDKTPQSSCIVLKIEKIKDPWIPFDDISEKELFKLFCQP